MHRSLASQQFPTVRFPLVDCFRLSPSSRLLSRAHIQAKRVQAVQHVSDIASVRDLRSSGSTRIAIQVQLRSETSVSKEVRNWPSLIYSISSYINLYITFRINMRTYYLISFLSVATMGLSNTAVAYLNYPTFNMFKSCKLIPVMIGSILILGSV